MSRNFNMPGLYEGRSQRAALHPYFTPFTTLTDSYKMCYENAESSNE